ncbi:MAG: hypothetical protein ACK5H1_10645 [Tenacibaculum sp.]
MVNHKTKKPAYILEVDFGKFGTKTSSTQLTKNHQLKYLINKQIVAVTNFAPKRIAGIKFEVLVLASICKKTEH